MPRVDVLLVNRGLAASRTAAQHLIDTGRVYHGAPGMRQPVAKSSVKLPDDALLYVEPHADDRFVSRGGLKLAGALAALGLDVAGWHALDVGISTGGFTDCLLQAGAAQVVGIDVGHGQLHPRLLADPRVQLFEGVNARAPDAQALLAANGGCLFDGMVGDVSFISLTLTLPPLASLLKPGGHIVHLVKPQFEVGREGIGRGGLVKDASLYQDVRIRMEKMIDECGLIWLGWLDSPITGGDGNREFFLHASKPL